MPARPGYYPETVVFVLDACEDPGIEYAKHVARLDLLKQCIGHCAQAKSRINPGHKFGLAVIRDSVQWEAGAVTVSSERLMAALRGVQPHPALQQTPYAPQQAATAAAAAAAGGGGGGGPKPLDLGEVVSLVQPLAVAEEADGWRVRVVLVYCRSSMMPKWTSRHRPGEALCMDVLFVHDKTAAAAATMPGCVTPQDVYTWLEDNVDELSGRCGHHAYIFEAGGHLVRKVTNLLISLAAHPAQRPPQRELRSSPPDLAAMPPQPTSARTAAASIAAAAAAAASATGFDSAAFPPLPSASGATTAPPAAAAPAAAGAWGIPPSATATAAAAAAAANRPRSYSPPGLTAPPQLLTPPPPPASETKADLINLASPSGGGLPPPPPPPTVAATATTSSFPAAPALMMSALPAAAAASAGGKSPVQAYRPPGLVPVTGSTPAAAAAASQALAGLTLASPSSMPPPPPMTMTPSVEGAMAVTATSAAAVDPWAAQPPAWSDMHPPPPPPSADPGPY